MTLENPGKKIESINDFWEIRNNLSFNGFLKQISGDSLFKFYEQSKNFGIDMHDTAHDLFICALIDQIQQNHGLNKDKIDQLFIDLTEYDLTFRKELAYIGSESPRSGLMEKVANEKVAKIKLFVKENNIALPKAIKDVSDQLTPLINEKNMETDGELRHYYAGAMSVYKKFGE